MLPMLEVLHAPCAKPLQALSRTPASLPSPCVLQREVFASSWKGTRCLAGSWLRPPAASIEPGDYVTVTLRLHYGYITVTLWLKFRLSYGYIIRVFAIYQILLGWETCRHYYETVKLPNPRPTQPKKKLVKSGIWATFFPQQIIFRGLGLILHMKQTIRNLTQPNKNSPQTPHYTVTWLHCGYVLRSKSGSKEPDGQVLCFRKRVNVL